MEKPIADYSTYYPQDYYSFSNDDKTTLVSRLKWYLRALRNNYYKSGKGTVGKFIHQLLPNSGIEMFHALNPKLEWAILDVGCGNDAIFLQHLSGNGFSNIFGIDPYIPIQEKKIGSGKILRESIVNITGSFDCITFHHSLEHIPNQHETLLKCASLLTDDGIILIRIPTVSSIAWNRDKEYWAGLDAPRHIYLHSVKSIQLLGRQCGMMIKKISYDSSAFQFWGAELYKRGIPLGGKSTLAIKTVRVLFRLYYSFRMARRIKKLNTEGWGDTIAVFMKKAP